MTLSQIELNKKQRGLEQFENTFFKGKKITQNSQQIAAKYTIIQTKMQEKKVKKQERKPKPKQPIDYA